MEDKRTLLKVKIKSLAEEARIIRKEEKDPFNKPLRTELYLHRVWNVRREARSALLAYGFLRGRSYGEIEQTCHEPPNWRRVERLVEKYGIRRVRWTRSSLDDYRKAKEDEKERLSEWRELVPA